MGGAVIFNLALIVIAVAGLLLVLGLLEWCSEFLIGLFED
jgi:hypothetical protein